MPETMQSYLEVVQAQIRWKRARPVLAQELGQHLEDQRDHFLKEGKSPEEAERLAVQDMGDPVTVGTELDRVHRPRPQWGLLGLTLALAVIGAVLRVTFFQIGGDYHANFTHALERVLPSLGLGTAAMLGMYFLDVSRLVRHARAMCGGALAVSLLPLEFLHSSYCTYYITITAALCPLAYALWLYSFRNKGWKGFLLTVLGCGLFVLISRYWFHLTGLFLLLFSGLILTLYAAGRDWFGVGRWKSASATLAAVFGFLAYLLFKGYLNSFFLRVMIALRPELEREHRGYMGWMLKMFWEDVPPLRSVTGEAAMSVNAGARVFGVGQELRPINFSHDLLPASMAVSWGWVPLALVLAALAVLILWLLVKGLRQSYLPGRLVVLAVVLTLGFQTLFSAALNFGFVLFSASLPLIVGNLQTVVDMALIGLALSVFRGDSVAREKPPLRQRKRLRVRFEYQ
nr:permease prefix domain 1-containing protein [uncultured Oscillibacter sp.]